MTIKHALQEFFLKLNGTKPNGRDIADVIRAGAESVSGTNVKYETADAKTIVLKSSTASSTKEFRISVDDSGALTATEITV